MNHFFQLLGLYKDQLLMPFRLGTEPAQSNESLLTEAPLEFLDDEDDRYIRDSWKNEMPPQVCQQMGLIPQAGWIPRDSDTCVGNNW